MVVALRAFVSLRAPGHHGAPRRAAKFAPLRDSTAPRDAARVALPPVWGSRLVIGALLGLLIATLSDVPAIAKPPEAPDPVYVGRHFGDPSVVRAGGRFLAIATGRHVLRSEGKTLRRWSESAPALNRLPTWARPGDVWAADLAKVKRRWVLYYSAPVAGLTSTGRCIGVATARKPGGTFTPVDSRPLVCPPRGKTPPAADQVPGRKGLPRHGVIDPSLFMAPRKRPILFYKTDGIPSTIRMLPLRRNGLAPKKNTVSREVLRSAGVVENPVVLKRGNRWHLFTSEGSYAHCTYATRWRAARSAKGWATATPQTLLDRASTGLCGPGGADVFRDRGRVMVAFHGWACRGGTRPCGKRFTILKARAKNAVRAMYVARLRFRKGVPYVARYLTPRT